MCLRALALPSTGAVGGETRDAVGGGVLQWPELVTSPCPRLGGSLSLPEAGRARSDLPGPLMGLCYLQLPAGTAAAA